MNFKSKEDYQKWLAYGHMHDKFTGPGQKIKIAGKPHKVIHSRKGKRG